MVRINFDDLLLAFDFVSSGAPMEHSAFVSLDTGRMYWLSETANRSERGAVFASSTPERSNDHGVVIERVIQMAGELSKVDAPQVPDRRARI